jgi:hypothetical protein
MNSLDDHDRYPPKLAALPKDKVWGGTRIAHSFRNDLSMTGYPYARRAFSRE